MLLGVGAQRRGARDRAAAVALLEQSPPGPGLARAYCELAYLLMLACDSPGAIRIGSTAIEYANVTRTTQRLPGR